MVLGFICEGQTERKIINSFRFQSLLRSLNITFLKVINTKGNGKLLPKFLSVYNTQLKGAWKIIILTDADKDTIMQVYDRIQPEKELHTLIISVKKIESWFLSNDEALKKISKFTYADYKEQIKDKKVLSDNVEELGNPYDQLKSILKEKTTYRALNKSDITDIFLENGFDIQKSNCDSAKYFVNKLEELAKYKPTSIKQKIAKK